MTDKAKDRQTGPLEPPDRSPVRLLTAGYILALVIIAAMSFSIHVIIDRVIAEQNSSAVVISARQAKIAQRITLHAQEYAAQPDALHRQRLSDSLALLEKSHEALIKGSVSMNVPEAMPERIRVVYFDLPYKLDERVRNFLEHGRALLAEPPSEIGPENEHFRYILESTSGELNNALEAAVTEYEVDNTARISRLQAYQRMALFVIFATLIGEAFLIFMPLVQRIRAYADQLEGLALTDELTGIDNYRCFMQKSIKELRRATRLGKPLCVAILDLDHFKGINDQYGHAAGDAVLKAFCEVIGKGKRIEDEFGRLGGEEFGLLLPHTKLTDAQMVCDRIRRMVEATPIMAEKNGELFITVSIGVAEVNPKAQNLDTVLHAADAALYRAKQGGRNRVEISRDFTTDGNIIRLETQRS